MSADDDHDKTPLEEAVEGAVDAFVYAPIGLLFDGPALFPKLVERGRNQVQVARMMGQMAVQMGQGEATKRLTRAQGQVRETMVSMGLVPPEPTATPAPTVSAVADQPVVEEPPARTAPPKKTTTKKTTAKKTPTKKTAAKKKSAPKKTGGKKAGTGEAAAASAAAVPSADTLGIPDYDSLSASQVVSRLRGLDADELLAVKAYESSTRGRKTILNRVTQLQKG